MLPSPLSALLGLLFILLGAAAVCLILESSRRTHSATARDRIIQAHRAAGYLFIALFCAMTWFMFLKVKDVPDELPLRSMLHILVAMVLAPLLVTDVQLVLVHLSTVTLTCIWAEPRTWGKPELGATGVKVTR